MPMSPPKIIAGRYEVLRELGRGGMGVVYLVQHVHTHEKLALKLLSAHVEARPEAVERFRREMRAPAFIKSDNVVRIMDADVAAELDGAPFYVMEYLVGCDVAHVLKVHGKLSAEQTVWILTQVARGIDKAHQTGIVHRDLKPDNLFIHRREDGSLIVKIFDFGLVRFTQQLGSGSEHRALTNTQSMLGTPLYMAPEQAKGGDPNAPIGPPADIWAIGMLCFELLTGKTYFGWDSLLQFVGQLLFSELSPPSGKDPTLPPAFDAWFARACHRTPGERFASAGAQLAELLQALGCDPARIEAAEAELRQVITTPAPKSSPTTDEGPTDTQQEVPPADPSLGALYTINAQKPLTLGSTPTMMGPEPSIGVMPTINAPRPLLGPDAPTQRQPVPADPSDPSSTGSRLRGWWFSVGLALIGLLIFLVRNRPQPQPALPDLAVPADLATQPVVETPAILPDLAVPPSDLAAPGETLVTIPTPSPDEPPNPKANKQAAPKRPLRPKGKSQSPSQTPQKPPEEYIHPTL